MLTAPGRAKAGKGGAIGGSRPAAGYDTVRCRERNRGRMIAIGCLALLQNRFVGRMPRECPTMCAS